MAPAFRKIKSRFSSRGDKRVTVQEDVSASGLRLGGGNR